ncbi:MAG: hypothetical protein Q7U04_11315 [Bacteriovorax sp.]|nr:hypothetical protein [Bacteriovorax sp.]
MAISEERNIRKILVKCPPLAEDAFHAFPFLIALSEEFPKAEINLLCEENSSLAYSFLPYKALAYERPKDKLSLIETHHFCANLNDIFNVDLFFDLENTFNSSFIGFNFRSKERVGYGVGWNKYFLTKKFNHIESQSIEKKCLNLLELYTGKGFQDLRISSGRGEGVQIEKIEQLFQEPVPPKFILIMLDNFVNVSKEIAKWTQFFDCFQNQKFIIWSMQDEDMISELFANVDLGDNELFMHRGANSKELLYLFNKVVGVVTNNVWSESLIAYYGVNAISFIDADNLSLNLPKYDYFKLKPQRFLFSNTGAIKYKYLDEEKDFAEMNLVVDHLHFQFKL